MGILDHFARLPLASIRVGREDRQRSEVDTKDLEASIRARGVLHPIIVASVPDADGTFLLHAGERRLEASRAIGLADIPVRFIEDLSPVEAQIIELEENAKRKDLPWQDGVRAIARIHRMFGEADSDWTLEETAEAIGFSSGWASLCVKVSRSLEDPKISGAGTAREAYNILARREQRASGLALEELMSAAPGASPLPPGPEEQGQPESTIDLQGPAASGRPPVGPTEPRISSGIQTTQVMPRLPPPLADGIVQESFLHWAPKYSGRKFNFVHCDFPYGVGVFSANGLTSGPSRSQMGQGHGQSYSDTEEDYFRLLETFCRHLDNFMAPSAHLMFWFSEKHRTRTLEMFGALAPSIRFANFPLIWVKSDNAGIASDVLRSPRHVYETCLLGARSGRNLVRVAADAYSAPTDKRIHPSTKPEPMLRHFMSMLVDETTTVFDPTCGSGSALRAAEALGASQVFGMDTDETTVGLARAELRKSRLLRNAAVGQGAAGVGL